MIKNVKNTKTIATMAIAATLAGALSMGTALPALAEEAAPDHYLQPIVAQDDATADEGAWDASADENGFAADAITTYAPELGATQNDISSMEGNGWWWRHVSPTDALNIAQGYFGIDDFDDWNFQVGRFRGIPAYRVEIDVDDDWQPWGSYYVPETAHYIAFVNYFTGQVMGAYIDYE